MQSAQFQLHAQIEDRHWWFVARRQILRELARSIAPPRSDRTTVVVDIGCGTGANLAAFADEYRCLGIDTSAEAIELAQQRFPEATFICGHAPRDIDHWLSAASVVLMTDVLEHVADDRGLLESIIDECSPGAQLLITVPADMRLWSPHDEAFGHFRRYDRTSLTSLLANLPVHVRLMSSFNTRLYPLVRVARSISRWRGKTVGRANTDFSLPRWPMNRLLQSVFAGEAAKLRKGIDGGGFGYTLGVSLIAILERDASETEIPGASLGGYADQAASIPVAAAHL